MQQTLSTIYTPFNRLKNEIQARWSNQELKSRVTSFLGNGFEQIIGTEPCAVICRSIATPNLELDRYLRLSKSLELRPVILEYHDKFVAKNAEKYHLCKLTFFDRRKDGSLMPSKSYKVINFNTQEGKKIDQVRTLWGESIVDFHHDILIKKYSHLQGNISDITDWFNQNRYLTKYYYLHFLSMFIRNAVLFDNFLVEDPEECSFFLQKVLPSFRKAEQMYGYKPLIYPALPQKRASEKYWYSYPTGIRKSIIYKMALKC
jgi:hypothetical protein